MNTEKDLIKRLTTKGTKDNAFKELLHLYKERLYWHIRKIVLSHDDADDVLQNTFIKVFKNIDKFKGDSQLYSWMYRIATNESLTFLKKKSKRLQISDEELQQQTINNLEADVYFNGDDIQLKLQKAIATLPQKQQLVFNMKYFDDIKYKDMANILDTSEGALKASYHMATKKIEAYLKSK
ncbi:RNA polymerase sigma factor [Mangrovimonas spongiae]|uniref:RNA polymerase sigma factor n=1 Tax=Mangrovimonas spongiae TaxID=2494697 RepID=A0A428JYS8_9FLAO|nr:RNA polymerase sigma factor [Mangrovimonas spongiae]RSK39319.1 RNA polymerase sigma factor [Mangrovimonas spongiae]